MLNRKIVKAVLLAAFLACISGLQVRAADISKSLVGTWRVASFSMTTVETNEVTRPFGQKTNRISSIFAGRSHGCFSFGWRNA
jgi:hypothetical protein